VSLPTPQPTAATEVQPPFQAWSRQLNDSEDFAQLFGKWGGQFHQMSRGEFRGSMQMAGGPVLRVFQAKTNQEVLTRGVDQVPFATFVPITPWNARTTWQGRRLSAGQLIAKGPNIEYFNQTSHAAVLRVLLVPVPTIEDAIYTLTGREAGSEISTWTALRPEPKSLVRLEAALGMLLSAATNDPELLAGTEGYGLQQECLRRLVDALRMPAADAISRGHFANRSNLVKHAVQFMHDRLDRPLAALDLCAELGVSDRILRRIFRETFGMGPLKYFRTMRLHEVRIALKNARGSNLTVENIARRWRFHRLGTFAAEYRQQFGERPSETLGVRGWSGVQQMTRRESRAD
jgi:AraC family ethanolamine operon transcriptional activator